MSTCSAREINALSSKLRIYFMKIWVSEPQISQTTLSLNIEQYIPMGIEQLRDFLVNIGVVVPLHDYDTETYSVVIDAQ